MDIKQKLNKLINEGNDVINKSYHPAGEFNISYYDGELYEEWISRCELFLDNHFSGIPLVDKFKQASKQAIGNGKSYFETMIGVLRALLKECDNIITDDKKDRKIEKIFISHSTNDKEYVGLLIQLLNNIGIPKDKKFIFCSSYEGYNIPIDEKIYDFIEKEFNKNIWVIFMLSNNYYNSVPCLNEMGATWVTKKEYTSILLPDFGFQQMNGAIDATKIAFYISDIEKINTFKNKVIETFSLNSIDENIWARDRDSFLAQVKTLEERDMKNNQFIKTQVKKVRRVDSDYIEVELRLINDTNSPIEFTQLILTLIDEDKNKYTFNLCDIESINKLVYGQEKRREVFQIKLVETKYNPIKHKDFEWDNRWVQGY